MTSPPDYATITDTEVITMIRIYSLSIQAFLHFTELKCFDIGFFRTRDEAQVVAHRYLSEVRGFRDFYCEASISEETLDADTEPEFVYTFFGTDEDDFGNAIGIAGPHCYADRERAEAALTDAMSMSPEKIWAIRPWQIGKCEWSNGFTPRMAG